ncbi:hypothetical protein DVH05_000419 [Phytophthora capsici]|nr:hypothetical protein DVH05_026115 [Phytophthora capsici]KAG1712679.1 hypothetical protein DVH05_000419 [Phytophthora capsici]
MSTRTTATATTTMTITSIRATVYGYKNYGEDCDDYGHDYDYYSYGKDYYSNYGKKGYGYYPDSCSSELPSLLLPQRL